MCMYVDNAYAAQFSEVKQKMCSIYTYTHTAIDRDVYLDNISCLHATCNAASTLTLHNVSLGVRFLRTPRAQGRNVHKLGDGIMWLFFWHPYSWKHMFRGNECS